jgi:hypothetical protein
MRKGRRTYGPFVSDISEGVYAASPSHRTLVLYFCIYSDEIEVCNPIGKNRGKHKLLVFYLQILNIPPVYRSKLNSVFPLAIARNIHLKRDHAAGFAKLLSEFLETINRLSTTGISFTIEGESHVFFGYLLCVLGDSLASNLLGGFKSSFNPEVHRYCRSCDLTCYEIPTTHTHIPERRRTKEKHSQQLHKLATLEKRPRIYWS